MCDIRVCLTKIPKSYRILRLLLHPLVALTYQRGYTQSRSPKLMQQRRKRRWMPQATY
jgi:hypothetical protein